MKRRELLAGIGAAAGAASAGCLASGSGAGTPEPVDRPVVEETWKAGPTEPTCETSGEKHFPFMNRNSRTVGAVPESADVATVERFTQERIRFPGEVTLLEKKPTRLAWRARSYDVSDRYSTELYYVGWVGEVEGSHAILVAITPGSTQFVHFLNSGDCPGGS